MAERDSTKTPVAAEALIAAAAPLALHRIPRGRPAPASGSARAPRPCPSRRPAPRRAASRPAPRAPRAAPSAAPPRRARPQPPGAQGSGAVPGGAPAVLQPRGAGTPPRARGGAEEPRQPPAGGQVPPEARALREGGGPGDGRGARETGAAGSLSSTTWTGSGPSCGPAEGGARPGGVTAGRARELIHVENPRRGGRNRIHDPGTLEPVCGSSQEGLLRTV